MNWLTFVAGAVLSWGVYGAMLHQGQTKLGSPLRALLCVGVAYFLIGVIVPVVMMMSQGQLDSRGWNASGATFATVAGALGAIGAACIIFSFRAGGLSMKLSDKGVEEGALPDLAAQAAGQWTGTFNPRPFDAEGAMEIYRAAF